MSANLYGFLALLIISSGVSLAVFLLVNKSLRNLLNEVVKMPDCTTFYSRIFFIGLLFAAVSSSLDITFDLKKEAAFMEYIWKVADGLAKAFNGIFWFTIAYLVILTILVAFLRKRNEQ